MSSIITGMTPEERFSLNERKKINEKVLVDTGNYLFALPIY